MKKFDSSDIEERMMRVRLECDGISDTTVIRKKAIDSLKQDAQGLEAALKTLNALGPFHKQPSDNQIVYFLETSGRLPMMRKIPITDVIPSEYELRSTQTSIPWKK